MTQQSATVRPAGPIHLEVVEAEDVDGGAGVNGEDGGDDDERGAIGD